MSALEQRVDRLKWFVQDGAPPHYALSVRHW
jgi:hypothetical protein